MTRVSGPGDTTSTTSTPAVLTSTNYNISTPTEWAQALLAQLGDPQTPSNIEFLVSWAAMEGGNWHNTASYNPLNTTLRLTGSTSMNSVGVQAFTSWQQGIAATIDTLGSYPQIMAALQSGSAMQANQSGQLAQDFRRWSGGGYSAIASNNSYGATTGGPTGTVSAAQSAAAAGVPAPTGQAGGSPVPPISDLAALDQYVRTNFPTDAWLLDIPDVKNVLEQAVANGDSAQQIQAAMQQTQWWQTNSQAVKNYEQQKANNPADYNFDTPGSIASQTLSQVIATAGQIGIHLSADQERAVAQQSMMFGWTSAQLQQNIAGFATYNGPDSTNASGVAAQLRATAAQYYITPNDQTLQSWVRGIAEGDQSMQQFQAEMARQASLKWTGFAPQLQQGYNMVQLTDSLRTDAAKTMEVDPSQIDFQSNPFYANILDYVPPNSQDGVHRVMTLSEMDRYLKSSDQWGRTQQARDQASQLEQTITQTFGKVG